jgi:hypothetical protein
LITPLKFTSPFLNAKHEFTFIYLPSRPLFLAEAVLEVVLPISLVERTIIVDKLSYPVNFISIPVSCIIITVFLD